ncbi:MAG: hypothetical protein RMJ36_05195 [Candidatus Calescibacterium sp.]|nr:hypothetical protein [Candidatus Calescibacterium sp.]MDW8133030.1 hypothetical protein [Candidatus Calescibacterium sp.]
MIKNLLDIIQRIKNKDISVWIKDNEIENRIDWIDLDVKNIVNIIKQKLYGISSYDNVILLGMGGSSLAPLVFTTLYPIKKKVYVLDTINPDQIKMVYDEIVSKNNIFIVSSKSGTTLETVVLYRYFYNLFPRSFFIFITDKDNPLDKEAKENNKLVFNPNPNIGGRYSAFTEFGLVPSFLAGVDIDKISKDFEDIKESLLEFINKNFLGFYEMEKVKVESDIYYLFFRYYKNDFVMGLWLEQLIAESTGKNKRGILPVVYRNYNFNVPKDRILGNFELTNYLEDLSKWMYVWFIYTAAVSSYLGVNPFNQPDVQLSKDVTNKVIKENYDIFEYYEIVDNFDTIFEKVKKWILVSEDYPYIAIQFYSSFDYFDLLENLRDKLAEFSGRVVVCGFGPRYLHSVGQFYKGGPEKAAFIQVIVEPKNDLGYINKYFVAQALGDLITMKNLNKKVKGFYVKAKN